MWPARGVAEFAYCPRLFYYMTVEGIFAPSADTEEGAGRRRTRSTLCSRSGTRCSFMNAPPPAGWPALSRLWGHSTPLGLGARLSRWISWSRSNH